MYEQRINSAEVRDGDGYIRVRELHEQGCDVPKLMEKLTVDVVQGFRFLNLLIGKPLHSLIGVLIYGD